MHRHSAHHRQPQFSKAQHHAFCLRKAMHAAAALGQTLKSPHKQFLLDAFYNVANACQTGALRQHEVEAVANITLSVLDSQRTPQKHCIDRDLLCTLFTQTTLSNTTDLLRPHIDLQGFSVPNEMSQYHSRVHDTFRSSMRQILIDPIHLPHSDSRRPSDSLILPIQKALGLY